MAPLAPKTLKRKYGGQYQANKKFKLYKSPYNAPMPMYTRELKFSDLELAGATLPTLALAVPILLNGIAAGSDINQRDGRKITMTSVELRGGIYLPSGATTDGFGRIMIIYDNQTNEAVPPIGSILQTTTNFYTMINRNNYGRYKIIWDEYYNLSLTGERNVAIKKWIPLKNIMTTYANVNNGWADIDRGALFLLAFGSTEIPSLTLTTRVKYKEI